MMSGISPVTARIGRALVAAAAVLMLSGSLAAQEQNDISDTKADDGLKVAVIDLQEVIRGSQRWKDFREKHGLEIGRMERSLQELKDHAQSLKREYQNLAPGSEEAKKKKTAIEETLTKFRQKKSEYQQKLQGRLGSFLNDTLGRVRNAVQTYAKRNDVDLVLKKGSLDSQQSSLQDANTFMLGVQVLYCRDSMDATEEVTGILDSNYNGQIEVK